MGSFVTKQVLKGLIGVAKKQLKKTVRNKSSFMSNASKYSPGTMIRSNGILYHLNNSREWTKI